jgi:endonuclease III
MPAARPRTVRAVTAKLWREYGDRARPEEIPLRDDPVASLVRTVLSQNTTDVNADRAYTQLLARYRDWDAVLAAPLDDVMGAIRPSGLATQKARTIQGALLSIADARGALDLTFLRDMPPGDALRWLTALEGVGPKTAACVLLFSLGMPAFPVDTHCLRIGKRLGWLEPSCTADRAHAVMDGSVPDELKLPLHLGMIRHGRARCRPTNPICEGCVIRRECPYGLA